MRRRTVLSALALAALPTAGCTAPDEPDATPTSSATTAPASSEPPSAAPTSSATTAPASSEQPSADETPARTEPTPDDPILFVLSNETGSERTVTLRLTRNDQTFVDETVALDAGDSREYDSGVRSPGQYELLARVEDGPERTMTLDIEAFDVTNGSNHFVSVAADEVRVYWEE